MCKLYINGVSILQIKSTTIQAGWMNGQYIQILKGNNTPKYYIFIYEI